MVYTRDLTKYKYIHQIQQVMCSKELQIRIGGALLFGIFSPESLPEKFTEHLVKTRDVYKDWDPDHGHERVVRYEACKTNKRPCSCCSAP